MSDNRIGKGNDQTVRDYHERTKHRLDRYAASPGYMDWPNQPDPFRTFSGADRIQLPHPDLRRSPGYDDLFSQGTLAATPGADVIARLFYHGMALSAWKQAPHTIPWSLRINPSSGALYPTECYLVAGEVAGLIEPPGVFHYAPLNHCLERRCRLSRTQWLTLSEGFPAGCLFIGLTSIYWRESWKYGERAFRYCHLDVGHAIGAIGFSAQTMGWRMQLLATIADADSARLLGIHLQSGIEAEHVDCLLVLYPASVDPNETAVTGGQFAQWSARIPDATFKGTPNRLSREHRRWPAIDAVARAVQNPSAVGAGSPMPPPCTGPQPAALIPARRHPAEQIIRQRRSAVNMDATTSLDRPVFYQMLQRTLPVHFPFAALPWEPRVSLAIFVHRVDDLAPGLYLLARTGDHENALRQSLRSDFQWGRTAGCPQALRFYRLLAEDVKRVAKAISCHQDIAADGAFSLGMLAQFDAPLAGGKAWNYPRLFWECGLIGQVLYLEAEAAGVRGTGIGCFFDDVMHEMLGLADHAWQSLYHFTVGGPVEDRRLKTIAAYDHR